MARLIFHGSVEQIRNLRDLYLYSDKPLPQIDEIKPDKDDVISEEEEHNIYDDLT